MRGSNTLFADIFEDIVVIKQRKGRSADLINQRNECLIDRYFYYGQQKLRYNYILDILSKEFFLSRITIPEVIEANFEKLSALKKQQPSLKYFKDRWPHLTWNNI